MMGAKRMEVGRGPIWVCLLAGALVAPACTKMSDSVKDPAAGMNGGFELAESGLPVNWLVYSPETIPSGSYELSFDEAEVKEGKQSLRFDVQECSVTGGWHSPGLKTELPAVPGETYDISFWIKNAASQYVVSAGGLSAKTGTVQPLDSSHGGSMPWRRVRHSVTVPESQEQIGFELSIRSPGTVWIDDVRIDPRSGEGGTVQS